MPTTLIKKKKRFREFIQKKLFLRLHMFLILTGTFLAGLLATKLLLVFDVKEMILRYPVALLAAYLAFFLCVKLWLIYISALRKEKGSYADALDLFGPDLPAPSISSDIGGVAGGGGEFGGAGASGAFDLPAGAAHDVAVEAATSTAAETASSVAAETAGSVAAETAGSAAAEAGGSAAAEVGGSVLGEAGGGCLVLIALVGILALIFGAGIYLLYEAPAILSEAAFELFLAAGLIRSMKKMDNPDWMGSVFRTTVGPFLIVVFLTMLFAVSANHFYPDATKFSEVIRMTVK